MTYKLIYDVSISSELYLQMLYKCTTLLYISYIFEDDYVYYVLQNFMSSPCQNICKDVCRVCEAQDPSNNLGKLCLRPWPISVEIRMFYRTIFWQVSSKCYQFRKTNRKKKGN